MRGYFPSVTVAQNAHPKRLDERVEPGWAGFAENLLRYGGIVVGLFVLWLGFLSGGFLLLLTGVLAGVSIVGGWLLGSFVARESWYSRPNAQPLTVLIVVAFPIALIAFAQIVGPLLTPPPTTSATFAGSLADGQESVEILAIDPRIEEMHFAITITSLDNGAVRWYVEDPTGRSAWSGRTDTPGTHDSYFSGGIYGGQWTIHVVSEANQAGYEFDWTGWTSIQTSWPTESPPTE